MKEQRKRLGMIITKQNGFWEIHEAMILLARELGMDIIPIFRGYERLEEREVQKVLVTELTAAEYFYQLSLEEQALIDTLDLYDTDILVFHETGELWKCCFNVDFIERMMDNDERLLCQTNKGTMSKSMKSNSQY